MRLDQYLISQFPPGRVSALLAVALVPRPRRREGGLTPEEAELIERLRAGEEDAFLSLVARYQTMLLRVAGTFVRDRSVAEEVVQDTWLGLLRGIDGFAGRSSLKTWLLRILVNRARSTGVIEHRTIAIGDVGPVVDRSRFDATGSWSVPPRQWVEESDDRLAAESLARPLQDALGGLPERQRDVVTLRDVDGLTSGEVCDLLGISEANQRVLLHRGRSRLRAALEAELEGV
jgi:RNA polymerase sigma-70 factor (ECF subfamily)